MVDYRLIRDLLPEFKLKSIVMGCHIVHSEVLSIEYLCFILYV